MLLSVASAMHTDPRGAFNLHNTEVITNALPISPSDWAEPGIIVMRTRLREATFDAFQNTMVDAGAEVWAPVRRMVHSSAFLGADFVYAAHDDPVLREAMQTYFYQPDALEGLAKAELHEPSGYGGVLVFDPLTFGTGDVAQHFHPRAAGPVSLAQREFLSARGPDTAVKEALLTSFSLSGAARRGMIAPDESVDGAVSVVPVFTAPRELACMLARVRNALDALPRTSDADLPADSARVPMAALPRGAVVNECCEGQVVQSPAVWSLRTDPRIMAVFERLAPASRAALPFDLPLVCTTGDQMRARARDTSRPWLSSLIGAKDRRMGLVSLGPSPLGLWTVLHSDIGRARELVDASGNLNTVPDRAEWQEPYLAERRIASMDEFIRYATINGASTGVLKVTFSSRGLSLNLVYTACPPGYMVTWDTEASPYAVQLPPTQMPPATQLVLGLRIGAQPNYTDDRLAERMTRGQCVERDPCGIPTGVELTGTELARVRGLLPALVPYLTEPTHATFQRDARAQNLLSAVPHVFNHYSARLRAAVQ